MNINIELNKLYSWQQQVIDDFNNDVRGVMLLAARRGGKTELAEQLAILKSLNGQQVGWVASISKYYFSSWRNIYNKLKPLIIESNKTDGYMKLLTGGSISFMSSDNPNSTRSRSFHFLIYDEMAQADELSFTSLYPTLADKQGSFLGISTPYGFNWFKDLYEKAETIPNWKAYKFDCTHSPHLTKSELESQLKVLGPWKYKQEMECNFLSNQDALFDPAYMENIMMSDKEFPREFKKSIIAVDLACSTEIRADYTSICFIGHINNTFYVDVYCARIGLDPILNKIQEIYNYYKPTQGVVFESNGFQRWIGPLFLQKNITNNVLLQNHSSNKLDRLFTLDSDLAQFNIKIKDNAGGQELLKELYSFPSSKFHDDNLDSLQMGIQALYDI